jgi:hypothetical protein
LLLPLDAVTNTFAILARRRVGKTYTASVMAEEFVHAGIPWVAMDPTGAWWGLRSSSDGKSPGLPVLILGGAHGDVPLEPTAGKVIADLVVANPGWYVIDLSLFSSNADQDRFATEFGERLYRQKQKNRFPMHFFLDESDSFVPQRPMHGQERMLGAYEAIVRRGGIYGLGITMISQRPAIVNKNVLTQCETLITLSMSAPQDQDAVDDWVKRNGTKEQRDEMMSTLASLKTGQAWVWSPTWLEVFKLVQIRERETFNSSATPKHGEQVITPEVMAQVDLDKLGAEIKATMEKVQADDPKALRAQIAELKRQLAARPAEPVKETKIERVEVPVFREGELAGLADIALAFDQIGGRLTEEIKNLRQTVAAAQALANVPQKTERTTWKAPIPTKSTSHVVKAESGEDARLAQGPKKILTACAQYPDGIGRNELTILTAYRRSTRDTYIQRLSEQGLVRADGKTIYITETGIAALGSDFEPLPVGSMLQDYWRQKLPQGERRIFDVLVAAYPRDVSREDISEATDFKRSTRDTYLQRMITKRIVENVGSSRVRASASLFD